MRVGWCGLAVVLSWWRLVLFSRFAGRVLGLSCAYSALALPVFCPGGLLLRLVLQAPVILSIVTYLGQPSCESPRKQISKRGYQPESWLAFSFRYTTADFM